MSRVFLDPAWYKARTYQSTHLYQLVIGGCQHVQLHSLLSTFNHSLHWLNATLLSLSRYHITIMQGYIHTRARAHTHAHTHTHTHTHTESFSSRFLNLFTYIQLGCIIDLAWSSDGTMLATASNVEGVRLWDATTWQFLKTIKDPNVRAAA